MGTTKQETILIADDAEINRAILRNLFETEYNLLEAENGEQAMMLLRQYHDSITVVLLDLVMPEKDGYEVLEEMRQGELLYHAPVIVITADDSNDNRVKVFELGASDIIAKPFEPDVVKSRVKNIIELGRYRRSLEALVEEQAVRAQESNAAVIDMLSSVIEYRSLESGQHIRRIRMFTKILLEDVAENYQEYNLDGRKIRLIAEASSMHDIGKIAIPDRILNKPGRLTDEEFEVMKTHTLKGCEILSGLDRLQDREYLQYAYQICRYHHERWDGRGYPDGLKGSTIPICAQVVAIADCYDALTTDRVYKKAIPPGQACSMILNGECGTFSQRLLESFKNVRASFAQLSEQYVDGLSAEQGRETQPAPEAPLLADRENTLEQSQLKYFALLRYLDATVMEADLNTGTYHLVYLQDQDFVSLRAGVSFEQSLSAFVQAAVHPEDRAEALKPLGGYIRELFDEGLTWREQRYRILDKGTGAYLWCRVSILRINLEAPHQRRVLIVWHKEGTELPETAKAEHRPEAAKEDPVMEQLFGGMQKYRCDHEFTLLHVGRGLTDLVGYSEKEIGEKFQNSLMQLIYPADRKKVLKQFREQRNTGKNLELEYRLTAKDGRIVWVSNRCMIVSEEGTETACGVLLDITRSRQAEERLRLSLERHNIIMEQTNDIIFEWDIVRDELYLSSNWEKQYGYLPITKTIRESVPKASHLHPDDMPVFVEMMDAMSAGVSCKEGELRIADAEGKYKWCRVRAATQFDLDGRPSKVVGVILDIDSQKKASRELEERAARDVLTGLYNKAAAQTRVETHLGECASQDLSALMLLDVDDFKRINDRYGHMFGDAVLVEIATKIAALFRVQDTVARIGGDEFLIFMPNVKQVSVAEQRAENIIHTMQNMLEDNLNGEAFSCSIGLAFSRGTDNDFQILFDHADRALYRAKAAGKDRYMCYRDEMRKGPIGVAVDTGRRTEIDSNLSKKWNLPFLIIRAFDILHGAEDFEQAVLSILALVGELFGISRIYIFESSRDGQRCSNTFEWCADGTESQKEILQHIAYVDDGHDYRDNFGDDGLFYCQNIRSLKSWEQQLLEKQSIMSTLQYAIREDGVFYGFVGFDDCKIRRLWTEEQIEALTFLGRLLSVFLLKNRAQEELAESVVNLQSVLDHQRVWLYVLDPNTYILRYINGRTKELVPEAETGQLCYEVFYHREKPCENCVMKHAKKTGQSTMEIYNPYLKLWVLADASIVEWNRKKACLVGCRDISDYKRGDSPLT